MTLALTPDMAALSLAPATATFKIEAQADNGLMGSLAVWGLEASHENGLPVRWHGMNGCRGGPSQKFYITKIGEPNMYRIEARADNGLMGSLAVWGLESSHENGLPVKWHDMSWFRGGPSQEFYITPPLR